MRNKNEPCRGGTLVSVTNRENSSKVLSLQSSVEILTTLGITNYDLFTYDKVLFVEGESDVQAFRLLFDAMDGSHLTERVKLVGLDGDGQLKSKAAPNFKRLLIDASAAKVGVPVGFLLDSGGRSDQEKEDLRKVLHTPPHSVFGMLDRAELENYLLHPKGIASLLARERRALGLDDDLGLTDKAEKVIGQTAEKGSIVLQRCFESGIAVHPYRKKRHSPELVREILLLDPEFLQPFFDELKTAIIKIGEKAVAKAVG